MASSTHHASLFLPACYLLATYLNYLCLSPPNPTPSDTQDSLPRDRVGPNAGIINGRRLVTLILWIWHGLITWLYPSPPWVLCPCRNNLSDTLFTPSYYTSIALGIVFIASPVRLLSFKQLGANFTFRLAKPKSLVTTGLYSYVRHPSYPTNWLLLAVNLALLSRLDGVFGCLLPSVVVRWGMGSGLWLALLVGSALSGLYSIWIRVSDEEAMLQAEFGKEWEEYTMKTKRFIPWLL